MNTRCITKGATDQSGHVRIIDLADGSPATGITYATAGLSINYRREGGLAASQASPVNLTLLTTAHTDSGFKHIANGYYRVDYADAAFATGADYVLLYVTLAGYAIFGELIQLVDFPVSGTATEAYATHAAAAKPHELLYMIYAAVMNFSISGTNISMKKVDGTTEAMVATTNDSLNPTQRIRAS